MIDSQMFVCPLRSNWSVPALTNFKTKNPWTQDWGLPKLVILYYMRGTRSYAEELYLFVLFKHFDPPQAFSQ